jgi:hypothetical protein
MALAKVGGLEVLFRLYPKILTRLLAPSALGAVSGNGISRVGRRLLLGRFAVR